MGAVLGNAAVTALQEPPPCAVTGLTRHQRTFTIPMANPIFQMAIAQELLPNIVQADGTVRSEANLLRLQSTAGDNHPRRITAQIGVSPQSADAGGWRRHRRHHRLGQR